MTDYHPDFEQDYLAFPKRNGQRRGKLPAYKRWMKLSAAEKQVMSDDIAKRNRQNGWGKYITNISTYVGDKMWEEQWAPWEPDKDDKDAKPNRGAVNFTPADQVLPHMTWAEITMGRLFASYILFPVKPLSDEQVEEAIGIKANMLKIDAPAFQADIDEDETTINDASRAIGMAFLKRLDQAFGREDADRIFAHAGRVQAPWKRRA